MAASGHSTMALDGENYLNEAEFLHENDIEFLVRDHEMHVAPSASSSVRKRSSVELEYPSSGLSTKDKFRRVEQQCAVTPVIMAHASSSTRLSSINPIFVDNCLRNHLGL